MMFQIARLTPADADGVLACCNPIPPLVRLHAADLAVLIQAAVSAVDTDLPMETVASDAVAMPTGLSGARVAATHHLYNPAGWMDDDAQPAVSLGMIYPHGWILTRMLTLPVRPAEERLKRCGPLRAARPSGMATLLSAGQNHEPPGRHRATRIAQSFMDLFAAFSVGRVLLLAVAYICDKRRLSCRHRSWV